MATTGDYRCKVCGYEFRATVGSLSRVAEYRCENCDEVKYIEMPSSIEVLSNKASKPKDPGRCICGGEFKSGLSPMCPVCKSRNTESTGIVTFLD